VPYVTLDAARPVRMWADPDQVEPQALDQIRNVAALPWVEGIAVMPDVHLGYGATVGSVIAMRDAVSPSAVGVDIGCGMSAVKTTLTASQLPDDLGRLRSSVEAHIPVGFNWRDEPVDVSTPGFWNHLKELPTPIAAMSDRARRQMGTLGGGNHFLEVCLDDDGTVWLMLHSGSRGIGKEIAEHHMAIARDLPHNQDLPDRDLAVFVTGTPEMDAYRRDLFWAQDYARANRDLMLGMFIGIVWKQFPQARFEAPISCHHNYVAEEHHHGQDLLVTRKGAIRAGAGDLGIIPGSMGTGSYIVRGLGNPAAYDSASHGAGRRMSRGAARRQFTAEDLAEQTRGVECRKDAGVVDEIPAAYKDIDAVMAQQTDLVKVVAHLKQVVCVKG